MQRYTKIVGIAPLLPVDNALSQNQMGGQCGVSQQQLGALCPLGIKDRAGPVLGTDYGSFYKSMSLLCK